MPSTSRRGRCAVESDKTKCCVRLWRDLEYDRCSRTATVERAGWYYCALHDPVCREKRREERLASCDLDDARTREAAALERAEKAEAELAAEKAESIRIDKHVAEQDRKISTLLAKNEKAEAALASLIEAVWEVTKMRSAVALVKSDPVEAWNILTTALEAARKVKT